MLNNNTHSISAPRPTPFSALPSPLTDPLNLPDSETGAAAIFFLLTAPAPRPEVTSSPPGPLGAVGGPGRRSRLALAQAPQLRPQSLNACRRSFRRCQVSFPGLPRAQAAAQRRGAGGPAYFLRRPGSTPIQSSQTAAGRHPTPRFSPGHALSHAFC